MADGRNGGGGGKGPTKAPPRPSADRKAGATARGKTPKAAAKRASAPPSPPEPLTTATATEVEAVVAAPIPRATKAPATSGADDADTAVNLPETFRASLAEITSRAARTEGKPDSSRAPKKPAAPPSKPPTLPPSTSAAPPPLPPAAVSSRPVSSRPAPPPPPSSVRRPSLVPSPITLLSGAPPAPISSRPSLASTSPLPPPPVHAFGPIPNATPTAPPAPVPAIFQPVLQVAPPAPPTLKGFGPGGAPLEASSSSPMTAPPLDSSPASSEDLARPSTPKAFSPVSSGEVPVAAPVPATMAMPAKVAYERAFRTWSMPGPTEHDREDDSVPLTYQVYSPGTLATPRPMSLSRIAEEAAMAQPKPSLAARFAVVALGLLTVLGTASVISFAMNDESPARAAKSAIDGAKRSANAPIATNTLLAPTALTTAAPMGAMPVAPSAVVVVEPKPQAVAAPTRPAAPAAKKAPAPAPRASALASDPWAPGGGATASASAPSSLRQVAPPPNPYGGTPSSVLRPPPGFKR